MRVRFTSIVWEDIASPVNAALVSLESRVGARLEGQDYGANIYSFLAVLVAVDEYDNDRFAKSHNRVGYVRSPREKRYRQLSLAVELSPSDIAGRNIPGITHLFVDALTSRLESPNVKLPSDFNWTKFTHDLIDALKWERR